MNKKGFTLIELLVTIIVIAIVMGIVFPSALRTSEENKNRMYQEYEKIMEEYALVSPLKGQNKIYLSDLDVIKKIKDDCEGYVELTSSSPVKYKAHIICGDYNTDQNS